MQPGDQAVARWHADRVGRVIVCKPHALFGHGVQVRRLDQLLTVTAKTCPAQVVGHDQDDVRPGWFVAGFNSCAAAKGAGQQGYQGDGDECG